ncbi:MAG TPA: DUF167 domain-containing protein [Anaerolineales bacterium]
MSNRSFHLHDGKKGAAIAVRVTPRASQNKIMELQSDGTVKVHITAAPVDDAANKELIKFMSEVLGVPKNRLDIVAGASGRDKIIAILDMDAETVQRRLLAYLE